jgi:hypothetical protein
VENVVRSSGVVVAARRGQARGGSLLGAGRRWMGNERERERERERRQWMHSEGEWCESRSTMVGSVEQQLR